MKKIEAIVEPSEVEGVKEHLADLGVGAVTVTEVQAFGASGGRTLVLRGMKYRPPFVTEAKIEMAVADEATDRALAILQEAAKTDEAGRSRVIVFSLDDTARLRVTTKSAAAV